jgi:hypothetical protein
VLPTIHLELACAVVDRVCRARRGIVAMVLENISGLPGEVAQLLDMTN